jgi:hypothetical protein
MDTQTIKKMDKDTLANSISAAGIFAYLMQFQNEITILVLITGLILNIIRIIDRIRKKKKGDN